MGKYCIFAVVCFCLGLVALVRCSRTYQSSRTDRNVYYGNQKHRLTMRNSKRSVVEMFVQRPHIQDSEYLDEMEEDWLKTEPLISGVLVDDTNEDDLTNSERISKRGAPDRGFYDETKQMILDLHNLYRSNVTPPAGNMDHMEWDDELAYFAQLWADNCVFEHGTPPNTEYSKGIYGQNLYLGHDPTAYNAMWMWYDEYRHYNLKTQYCAPREQCGHYVQMAWGTSNRLGCGIRKCQMRYLIVCHYHSPAIRGQQMYLIAKPCSQCSDEKGSMCRNNLCFSWDQCSRLPHLCASAQCNLQCHNCGQLDQNACRCECADGWDSPDCSRRCVDEHERCGVSPGFPNKATCSMNRHAVEKKYCRKMCGKCNAVVPGHSFKFHCCEGKLCDDGSVLDYDGKVCSCTLLCPGPRCDGCCLQNKVLYLIIMVLTLYLLRH